MALLLVAFVLCTVVPIGAGLLAHRRHASVAGGPAAWGEWAARRLGRVGGSVAVLAVGTAFTAVVCLGLGFLAKALQSGVDEPVFRWVDPRVHSNRFTGANEKLTLLGNNPIIQLVALVAVIVLAAMYRRRWLVPVVAIVVALVVEKYLQKFLAKVVDRGHPPTTLGTFPSGGVGRILAIYGTIVVLVIAVSPALSRAWRAGLWTGLATGATLEAFTRVYLSKHWFTDALFGLPFGALLMLTFAVATFALALEREPVR